MRLSARSQLVLAVACVLAIVAPAFIPSPASGQQQCGEPILAVAPIQVGHPLPDDSVLLFEADGSKSGTLTERQPALAYPTSMQGVGLLRSLGGMYSLVDRQTLQTTSLEFPGAVPGGVRHESPQFVDTRGKRYVLFGDPNQLTGYLVDLEIAAVVPLSDLAAMPDFRTQSAMVDATDHYLAFSDGTRSFLVDLTRDLSAISIGDGLATSRPMVSDSGTELFFLQQRDARTRDLKLMNLDTANETTLITGSNDLDFRILPGDLLVILDGGNNSVGNIRDFEVTNLTGFTRSAWPVLINAAGTRLLVREEFNSDVTWALVDLETNLRVDLPELVNSQIVSDSPVQDYVLFRPTDDPGHGIPGASYIDLDMQTMAMTVVLTQDGNDTYSSNYPASRLGRYRLVQSVLAFQGRLWLIDGATPSSQLVGQSSGNASGALSPDGCYLAVSTFDTIGEGRKSQTSIMDLERGIFLPPMPDTILLGWIA